MGIIHASPEFVVLTSIRDCSTGPEAKATRLRTILTAPELSFLMEAHSAVSAKVAENAGFEGIWASGLSMSAAMGVRDNNELSWSQVLDQLEFMADATRVPILVDGDTGYGNFNNFRRFVRKLCDRGIAGVCIEDKVFPKTNSFLGEGQELAPVEEFCGKIRAGKDSQTLRDFSVVARIEALIAGRGMDEALMRADAYATAGADALVIHSKKERADEILEFCRQWDHRVPVILIPTKYYRTPTETLRASKASTVIWANHSFRASVQAMIETCEMLKAQETLIEVESRVLPLDQVFALNGADELAAAERRYLAARPVHAAIVLAASRGDALGALTQDQPKCMLNVRGKTILQRQVDIFRRLSFRDVTVVAGYRAETVSVPGTSVVVNADFARTGEAASLYAARDTLSGACVVTYGDIVFPPFFLDLLLSDGHDIALLVDPHRTGDAGNADHVRCSQGYEGGLAEDDLALLSDMGPQVSAPDGQWIGLMAMSAVGSRKIRAELEAMRASGDLALADLAGVLRRLVARGEAVQVRFVSGNWMNVNDLMGLAEARNAV